MKFRQFFIFLPVLFLSVFPAAAAAGEKTALVAEAIQAAKELKSIYFEQKTTTGSISTANTKGAIDYQNKKMYSETFSAGKLIKKIYCRGSLVYIYEGISGEWIKMRKDDYYLDDTFARSKFFLFMDSLAVKSGFGLQLSESIIDSGRECYVFRSTIEDPNAAKKYLLEKLPLIFGTTFADKIKQDLDLLNDYLNSYLNGFSKTVWVLKSSLLPQRVKKIYNQPVGAGSFVKIEEDTDYYDYNEKVKVIVPEEAEDSFFVPGESSD